MVACRSSMVTGFSTILHGRSSAVLPYSKPFLIHAHCGLISILVRVPVPERDVFRSDFNESSASLGESARQQTSKSEPAGVIGVIALLRLERQIERLGGRRFQQAMRIVGGAKQAFLLVVAAVL